MKRKVSLWFVAVIVLYFVSIVFRIIGVKNGNFPFWFDVGRDAIVSRELLEKHDLKIQGPTASGTDDSVYHGVLYYYLIGPLYTLFQGDPQQVLYVVIVLSSLAIFPVYALGTVLADEKVGLLAALLYAFSYDAYRGATWLSNPVMAVVAVPLFFYLLYMVFWEKKIKLFLFLMASLALLHQAVILFAPWWGILFITGTWHWQDEKLRKLWRWQTIVLGFVVYLLGVSTMIVAQLRALVVGVFRPGKFESFAMRSEGDLKPLAGTLSLYLTKVTQTFFPMMPVLSILVVLAIALFLKNQKKDKQSFILLMASSPLWLLAWHFRNMNHSFLGLESLAVILLAWLIIWLWQQKWQWLSLLLVFLFLYNQMQMMKVENELQRSMYFVPQGANYSYLLQAVDYTYQQANGQKFTISSLTNPFGYNTLWAYLYSWYGQRQYGYMPSFVGPDQTGIFGGDLLPQQSTPSAIHFAIEEPGPGIPDILYVQFMQKQDSIAGTSSASKLFGSLRVIEYNQK